MRLTGKLFVTLAVLAAALGSGRSAEPKPVGNWTRQCGPVRISLKFTENRLTAKAVISATEEQKATTISLDADYSVNPEGIVYGLVTGIDADEPDLAADLQILAGHTFAARCRVDGDTLSIRDVKYLGIGATTDDDDELTTGVLLVAGRYQRDDGKRPAQPKKGRTAKTVQSLPIQQNSVELPSAPPVVSNPLPVVGIPVAESALIPAGVVSQPAPASPAITEFAYPRPTGEWVRDVHSTRGLDPRRLSLKFTDNHLVFTVLGMVEDKPYSQTIDADYSITKDGLVFGVITSASANIPVDSAEPADEKMAQLTDQLLSFRFRLDHGALTIKDMKMPTQACKIMLAVPTGRYVPAADAPPMNMRPTTTNSMTLPSGRYLQHYPQYFPPEPASRLPRELNKLEMAPMPRPVGADSNTTPERIHGGILP